MRPLGASTPALLTSTSRRPNRSRVCATTASPWSRPLTAASTVSTGASRAGSCATVAASAPSLTSLTTTSVSGSPARRALIALPSVPPAPVIAMTLRPSLILPAPGPSDRGARPPLARRRTFPFSGARSYEQISAVDGEDGARDEGGGVGCEELVRPDEIAGLTPALLRGVTDDLVGQLRVVHPPVGEGRVEPAGRHDVHRDAGRCEIEREPFRETDEPGLRRAVRGETLAGPLAEHGAGEDQTTAVGHDTRRGARAEECTREVHVDDVAPHRRVDAQRAADDRGDAGVADPHVDAAPLGDGAVGDGFVEVGVADVAREDERRPRQLGRDLLEVGLGAGDEGHERAGVG